MIAACGSWMPGFDNLSYLSSQLSDALCQISTGAGFTTRRLYSDAEEVVFEAMRPLLLNGIGGFMKRPDQAPASAPTASDAPSRIGGAPNLTARTATQSNGG